MNLKKEGTAKPDGPTNDGYTLTGFEADGPQVAGGL